MRFKKVLSVLAAVLLAVMSIPIVAAAEGSSGSTSGGEGYDQEGHLVKTLVPFEKITAFDVAASSYSEKPIKFTVPKDGYYNLRIQVSSKFKYVSHPEHSLSVLVNETEEVVHKREKEYYGYYPLQNDANGRFQQTFSYGYNFSSGYTYTFTPYLLSSGSITDINWYACEIRLESEAVYEVSTTHTSPVPFFSGAAKRNSYVYQGAFPKDFQLYKDILILDEPNKTVRFPTPEGLLTYTYDKFDYSPASGPGTLSTTSFYDAESNHVTVSTSYKRVDVSIKAYDGTTKNFAYIPCDASAVSQDSHGTFGGGGVSFAGATEDKTLYTKNPDGSTTATEHVKTLDEANKTVTIVTNEGSKTYNYTDYYYYPDTNTTSVFTEGARYDITSYDDHTTVNEYNSGGNTYIYNYYYSEGGGSGGGSSSEPDTPSGGGDSSKPDNPGGSSSEPDNPSGGEDEGGGFFEGIKKFFNWIGEGLKSLVNGVKDAIEGFKSLFGEVTGFFSFISAIFSFLPDSFWQLIFGALVLIVFLRVFGR